MEMKIGDLVHIPAGAYLSQGHSRPPPTFLKLDQPVVALFVEHLSHGGDLSTILFNGAKWEVDKKEIYKIQAR